MKSNLIMLLCLLAATAGFTQDENLPKPELTEVWEPVPKIVEPSAKPGDPPSDAIILFNGKNLDEWMSPKEPERPCTVDAGRRCDHRKKRHRSDKNETLFY